MMNGVLELQKHGIFHADLEFRNTIQVKDESGRREYVYKIIDFDYAFKVR